jgi:uncharacterized protein YecE (DUF72 family)
MTNPYPLEYSPSDKKPIPSNIYLGTSSWTHDFWKGQIYHRAYRSEKEFNTQSLGEFAALGLFKIVEIDSTFYAPPKEETLEQYASLVPENFLFTAKIWERISIPVFPSMKRYGPLAGQENPFFLDPKVFVEEFLPPFLSPAFSKKLAAFLIQFPAMPRPFVTSKLFLQKLTAFFEAFPKQCKLAVEIRNQELLVEPYFSLLNLHDVSHCFNQWQTMPSITDQMKKIAECGGLKADFLMARLLTPLGVTFEKAKEMFEPFYQIGKRDEHARQDVLRLARRALQRNVPAYIIVNNRFEGNSPITIKELEALISDAKLQDLL